MYLGASWAGYWTSYKTWRDKKIGLDLSLSKKFIKPYKLRINMLFILQQGITLDNLV